ncbi:MAG: DUF6795 domain-containing protein [Pseudomonadota bacterium]
MAVGKTFVICSPVEGLLLGEGNAPASGIEITRTWKWGKREGEDTVTTDAEGRFSLPQVDGQNFWASVLPHQPNIEQDFSAQLANGPLQILLIYKQNYNLNGERDGKALNIQCRADQEPGANGFFWGTCQAAE